MKKLNLPKSFIIQEKACASGQWIAKRIIFDRSDCSKARKRLASIAKAGIGKEYQLIDNQQRVIV